jgi:hypothetical protein
LPGGLINYTRRQATLNFGEGCAHLAGADSVVMAQTALI